MVRVFRAAAKRCAGTPVRYRWVLTVSDGKTPHSRSDQAYPTEEAALSEGEALAAVFNAALEHGAPKRKGIRR
ncbi:hypothetical protein [Methylorubrum thiocyanatum]|uniref:hypothetical protein n=1 Tax=Methylorubrum thiocyanatum TaxID=47958 RepID=UPI0035C80953